MVGNTSVVIEQDCVGAGGGFETAITGIAESQIAVVPEDLDLRKALARTLQTGGIGPGVDDEYANGPVRVRVKGVETVDEDFGIAMRDDDGDFISRRVRAHEGRLDQSSSTESTVAVESVFGRTVWRCALRRICSSSTAVSRSPYSSRYSTMRSMAMSVLPADCSAAASSW